MEEKNHTTAPDTAKKCICCRGSGWGAFVVGLIVALILGWCVLPNLMKKELKQPIAFNHVTHIETVGMACTDCHFLQDNGAFSGAPTTESCADCHFTALTDNPEEIRFVEQYAATGREIKSDWLIYQKQPDNVFFSHAAHSQSNCGACHENYAASESGEAELCGTCHLPVFEQAALPKYRENRLSGYSEHTMIMWTCERCHADPGHRKETRASNACFVCHK